MKPALASLFLFVEQFNHAIKMPGDDTLFVLASVRPQYALKKAFLHYLDLIQLINELILKNYVLHLLP